MNNPAKTVVIVGGAILGSFCAYFLKTQGYSGRVVVLEKDPSYQFASTALSAAAIRTQFGTPLNVEMSLFGAQTLRSVKTLFGDDADIGFREDGYLILGTPETASGRIQLLDMQNALGADILALTDEELIAMFPWVNPDGLSACTYGRQNEGWFDAWSLLRLVIRSAKTKGVEYIHCAADELEAAGGRITTVVTSTGERIACDYCINAAGPGSAKVVSSLDIELPVEPRKRTVFGLETPLSNKNFPMLLDISGAWARPEGEGFIGGIALNGADDTAAWDDFNPDYHLFEEELWPLLAERIPEMERLRMTTAWAGHYEVNTLDQNGIVGPHTTIENLLFATGFSGHGVMHAPAVGRAVAEWIVHNSYQTLDLSKLGYARIAASEPLIEAVVF